MCFLHFCTYQQSRCILRCIHDVTIAIVGKTNSFVQRCNVRKTPSLSETISIWNNCLATCSSSYWLSSNHPCTRYTSVWYWGCGCDETFDKGVEILWRGSENAGWQHHEPGLTAIIAHTERLANVPTLKSGSFEWLDPSIIGWKGWFRICFGRMDPWYLAEILPSNRGCHVV